MAKANSKSKAKKANLFPTVMWRKLTDEDIERVEKMKAEIESIEDTIDLHMGALDEARRNLTSFICKFKVGDVVEFGSGQKIRGVVRRILPGTFDDPILCCDRILKSGDTGLVRRVYSFDNPTLVKKGNE